MVNKDLGMVTAYAYAVSKGYTGTEEEFAALMADYAAVGQRAEAAATAAAASATAASGSASDSAASATAAEGFAGNASTAAGNASQAAQNASQSATAASGSATSAAGSATAAAGSATTAGNKATEAAQSATAAAGSATTAGASATAAQAAQTAAETAQGKAEDAQAAAEAAAQTLVIDPTLTQANQAAEAKATGDAISLVKSHLNATEIVDTASGAIASFADGSDGVPVESLTVSMEPIQDLHGQDAPYPPGGKGNLFNYEAWKGVSVLRGTAVFENNGITITATGNDAYTVFASTSDGYPEEARIPVTEGETITLAWEETTNTEGSVYIFPNGSASGAVNVNNKYAKQVSYTAGSGVTFVSFRLGVNNAGDSISYKNIQVVKGTTVPAWSPYSNICPISGRQSVTATRAGANWFDIRKFAEVYPNNCSYNESTGELTLIADNVLFNTGIDVNIPLDESNGGYLQCDIDNGTSTNIRIKVYYADGGFSQTPDNFSSGYVSRTLVMGKRRVTSIRLNWSTPGTFKIKNFCITQGTTAVDYIAPQFQTVTVPLGQTVYGGTLDVVSGEMVVDRAMVDLGTLTWNLKTDVEYGEYFWGDVYALGIKYEGNYYQTAYNALCSQYSVANRRQALQTGKMLCFDGSITEVWQIQMKDSDYSDATAFKTAMNGVQLCYKLATPITITLTPEQLTTLLGVNNVWSDADSVSVDYVADTKLYIEQLTEPDADMVADANITSGQYFMVGNALFLATSNIANGSAIVPGTNCTRTNLAEALNAINS